MNSDENARVTKQVLNTYEEEYPGRYRESYRAYKANQLYYIKNFEDIKTRLGGKIIIICKEKVISISNNFVEYERELSLLDKESRSEAYVVNVPIDSVIYMI
jgi:hypothetical protein